QMPSPTMPKSNSPQKPHKNVEYTRAMPAAFNLVTKTSPAPLCVVSKAPGVVGKSVDKVSPVTKAEPVPSTAMPRASSSWLPPKKVEYTRGAEPSGFNFVTKTSLPAIPPWYVVSKTPDAVGKSDDMV